MKNTYSTQEKVGFQTRRSGGTNRQTERPNSMDSRSSRITFFSHSSCVLFVLGCVGLLAGCATSQEPLFQTKDEHYQSILERQKAGIPLEEELTATDVPEFTVEEYERLGDSHATQGNVVLAAMQYEKALEMVPQKVPVRYKVAWLYLEHGKSEKAYDRFHEILDYDFEYAPAYEGMGRALLKMGKDEEAELEFTQALLFDPNLWSAHNFLGIIFDRRYDHKAAVAQYQKALSFKPDNPNMLNNLGMAYLLSQEYQKAVQVFQQAVLAGAKSPKIWNNLGLTHTKLGQYAEAFDAFQGGMDAARAYNNLGIVFLEDGQPARAMKCFEQAIKAQPSYYEKANNNLELAKRDFSKLSRFQQRAMQQRQGVCL